MSKLEIYQIVKDRSDSAIKNINKAMGYVEDGSRVDTHNDKHNIHFSTNGVFNADKKIYLNMSYGFYGNSSSCFCCNDAVMEYMIRALNAKGHEIAKLAKQYAEEDTKKALLEAEEEALNVLAEIKKVKNED